MVCGVVCNWQRLCPRNRISSCESSFLFPLFFANVWNEALINSCLSGNGSKDVAEVLLTLKKKEWADKLEWQVAQ